MDVLGLLTLKEGEKKKKEREKTIKGTDKFF